MFWHAPNSAIVVPFVAIVNVQFSFLQQQHLVYLTGTTKTMYLSARHTNCNFPKKYRGKIVQPFMTIFLLKIDSCLSCFACLHVFANAFAFNALLICVTVLKHWKTEQTQAQKTVKYHLFLQ